MVPLYHSNTTALLENDAEPVGGKTQPKENECESFQSE